MPKTVQTPLGQALASPTKPDRPAIYMARAQAEAAARKIPGAQAGRIGTAWVVVVSSQ